MPNHFSYPGLTQKQADFCYHYVHDAGAIRTVAARLAGYKFPEQDGHRLMKNETVQQCIDDTYDDYLSDGIIRKKQRIKSYQDTILAIQTAFADRAAQYRKWGVTPYEDDPELDEEMRKVSQEAWLLEGIPPEALTGLYIREVTITAGGTKIVRWAFDGVAVKELREAKKQLAIETGEWTENKNITGNMSFVALRELADAAGRG